MLTTTSGFCAQTCRSERHHQEGEIVDESPGNVPSTQGARGDRPNDDSCRSRPASLRIVARPSDDHLDMVLHSEVAAQLPQQLRGVRSVRRKVLVDDQYSQGRCAGHWSLTCR